MAALTKEEKAIKKAKARKAEVQRNYSQSKQAAGYKRVSIWVPDEYREEFDKAVRKVSKKWALPK